MRFCDPRCSPRLWSDRAQELLKDAIAKHQQMREMDTHAAAQWDARIKDLAAFTNYFRQQARNAMEDVSHVTVLFLPDVSERYPH